jgi:hypothetical protein
MGMLMIRCPNHSAPPAIRGNEEFAHTAHLHPFGMVLVLNSRFAGSPFSRT